MELNENYNAETWLAEWWPIVLANFRVIKNAYDAEASTRKAADDTLQTNIDNEASARTAADNAIANGTRLIKPNLSSQTQYSGTELGAALDFLTKIARRGKYDFGYTGLTFEFDNDVYLGGDANFDNTTAYSGFSSLAAMAEAIAEINTVVDSEVALTDLDDGSGRYSADTLPRNKLIRLTNDTNTDLTFFQDHDEYGTVLSEPIPAGESRLIVKVLESYGGAETTDGYIYVLNGQELNKAVGRLDNRISTVKNAVDIINGDDTVPGSVNKKIKNAVDPIANGTREIAPLLYPETKYFNGDGVSVITAGLNFIRWITHSYESLYPGGALKDIYTLNNNIRLGDKALLLDPEEYCGWKSLWDLAASVCNYADGTDTISPYLSAATKYNGKLLSEQLLTPATEAEIREAWNTGGEINE